MPLKGESYRRNFVCPAPCPANIIKTSDGIQMNVNERKHSVQ